MLLVERGRIDIKRHKIEFHTHTKYSHDSLLNKYLYLIMLKIKKVKMVAITDHNEIDGAINFKLFLEKYGIRVIVGEEIMSTDGEIIGLFLNKRIAPGYSPRETMIKIKEQNGLVYIPHPYDEKRKKTVLKEKNIKENLDLIDMVEIHNGRNLQIEYSIKQEEIKKKYNLLGVVGSDAHLFLELGRNYNYIEFCINGSDEELKLKIKEIKSYKKQSCKNFYHTVTKIIRGYKKIKIGEYNELYRIISKKCKSGK